MRYRTYASLRRGAARSRLERLLETLSRYDCVARLDIERHRLVLELPEDDFEWIVTGGLADLLANFVDCLAWEPRFSETRGADRPRLPPPGASA
jgi:hypothetical protein